MLFLLNPGVERLDRVVPIDGDRNLGDDRPGVDSLVDDVHGDTGHGHTVTQRRLHGMGAGKGRQERRVDVQDPIRKAGQERRSQDTHEPCENHPFCPGLLDDVGNGGREGVAIVILGPEDCPGRHTACGRPLQGRCLWSVGDDEDDVGADFGGVEQRLEIGARSRSEHCDVYWYLRRPGRQCRQAGRRPDSQLLSRLRAVTAITQVPAADWETWVDENDATILDVREPREWDQGTLPGAVLIPLGEIVDRIEEIPKNRPVLCVCRSGGRSTNVAAFLAFNDFEAANMSGGMKALGMQD